MRGVHMLAGAGPAVVTVPAAGSSDHDRTAVAEALLELLARVSLFAEEHLPNEFFDTAAGLADLGWAADFLDAVVELGIADETITVRGHDAGRWKLQATPKGLVIGRRVRWDRAK